MLHSYTGISPLPQKRKGYTTATWHVYVRKHGKVEAHAVISSQGLAIKCVKSAPYQNITLDIYMANMKRQYNTVADKTWIPTGFSRRGVTEGGSRLGWRPSQCYWCSGGIWMDGMSIFASVGVQLQFLASQHPHIDLSEWAVKKW